ncbi:hypothetical protein [Hanstruepera marina]|uniref:hypothetical protein n=1 Tax=Hanstruepera marina TaxID=2873265 RepID=UPI001CA6B2B2|nr:hypothetical protein [Hanstruepera marina]
MKTNYLLPNKYKLLGWVLLIPGLIAGILMYSLGFEDQLLTTKVFSIYSDPFIGQAGFFKIIENGIADELTAIAIIVGGLLVGFSKEKIEDEFIYKLRTESLVWSIIFNYVVLLFTILFVYDMAFFNVLIFNMFTPLLFFIIRFNFLKLKSVSYEE